MTIYLPETIHDFRKAFDEACNRILQSEQERSFFALLVQLVICLQEHSLVKNYILQLEAEEFKRKHEFNKAALEALEDLWERLLKYHKHSLKHSRKLVLIKRKVTTSMEFESLPLYNRVLFAMMEFSHTSPVNRPLNNAPTIFLTSQSTMELESARIALLYSSKQINFPSRKVTPLKLRKKDKQKALSTIITCSHSDKKHLLFRWSAEELRSALYSPKVAELDRKFSLKGQNSEEKRCNRHVLAETSPMACWERLFFLHQCYTVKETIHIPKHFKGHWSLIREQAWQTAIERCEQQNLCWAKMALDAMQSSTDKTNIDIFLTSDHQIHRRDYEKYLKSLQHHIHTHLFKIESEQLHVELHNITNGSRLALPGTQRKAFAIELAMKYWKINPNANYDEVFGDYLIHNPTKKPYVQSSWERIIRNAKIDPRTQEKKVRSQGKKTLQN